MKSEEEEEGMAEIHAIRAYLREPERTEQWAVDLAYGPVECDDQDLFHTIGEPEVTAGFIGKPGAWKVCDGMGRPLSTAVYSDFRDAVRVVESELKLAREAAHFAFSAYLCRVEASVVEGGS